MEPNNIQTDVGYSPRTPITWKGREVPWVTRWTNERNDDPMERALQPRMIDGELWITQPAFPNADREASGFLWQHEGITRGGRPEFAQVSTYRQRAAMRKRLCQVCGQRITAPVINWLMGEGQLNVGPFGELLTLNAPTCDTCVPIAQELCPHLQEHNGGTVIKVLEYELWGVLGEAVRLVFGSDGSPDVQHDPPVMIPYRGEPEDFPPGFFPTAVLAKQQVVELTKYLPPTLGG